MSQIDNNKVEDTLQDLKSSQQANGQMFVIDSLIQRLMNVHGNEERQSLYRSYMDQKYGKNSDFIAIPIINHAKFKPNNLKFYINSIEKNLTHREQSLLIDLFIQNSVECKINEHSNIYLLNLNKLINIKA
mgnify:CR=1 FL=1